LLIGDELMVSKFPYGYSRYSVPLALAPSSTERFLGRMPERGDVVVFRLPSDTSETYVKRVVGLPGDRIQMRDGVLFINGKSVNLKPDGVGAAEEDDGSGQPARRYIETLPGGVSHTIFKIRDNGRFDNTPEVLVPPDRLFVMGDNRDNSADSRVSVREGGVGLLPMDNLVGRVDAIVGSWDLGMRNQPVSTWLSGFRVSRFFSSVH
jgi:signal peptidase I